MARYIDADKLIAEYDRVHVGAPGGARKLMVDAPTADVVEVSKICGFTVIDNTTGAYPDCEEIALTEEWAKHLIYCDIDTFAINEDGSLILMDDCGNCAFCPADRFTVVYEKGGAE